jgi:hypothetical protein
MDVQLLRILLSLLLGLLLQALLLLLFIIRRAVIGGWRKLHNEELHNLYCSPSMIRIIKSRKMIWASHVARMRRRGMHVGFWWESQKEIDH